MKKKTFEKDSSHQGFRNFLRVMGFILLFTGGIFSAIGLISFFSAFGTMQMPKNFWCLFLGMPLMGLGIAALRAGFMGKMANYTSNEITPVIGGAAAHIAGKVAEAIKTERVEGVKERLQALDDLRNSKIITQHEYDAKRKEILDSF